MTGPDWAEVWRSLAVLACGPEKGGQRKGGHAREAANAVRAARFDAAATRKASERPDTLLNFVLERLRPEHTVLDIGAGTGRFAIPFARVARSVTAVDPSAGMAAALFQKAAAEGLSNIRQVNAAWEDAQVEPHDVAFCSHAMYSSPDLAGFVRKMELKARGICFLAMRIPSHDGVMRELSCRVHGQPHDSPNFWVGYQALYDMGIYASVVMEPGIRCWADDSLDAALQRARRHLGLGCNTAFDDEIREALARRLSFRDGRYHWPDGMRSAMIWWEPSR